MTLNTEQQQKIFDYLKQEYDIMLLDSDFREIENIITNESLPLDGVVKPQGVETEEITKEIFGEWKLINKIERKCICCNNNLYSAEIKNILHGHQRATICTTCKTIHIQDRTWNGK